MNTLERGIIDLLNACLTGKKAKPCDEFGWQGACDIGKQHNILSMMYYGVSESDISIPDEALEFLKKETLKYVFVDQNQLYEIGRIEQRFIEDEIDFLPLKGTTLKFKYPHTEARMMTDADILIKTGQYEKIRSIMQDLGYKEQAESDHELIWDKAGALHLELHKRLIPSYNQDYYAYFGDGWSLAHRTETTKHEMRCEDEFVYLFVHYAKHYRDGGIGIRHLTDLYVFLSYFENMNLPYIENELKKLDLLAFYKNSMETLSVWFDGCADTEMSDFITDKIFHSGSYGTYEAHTLSEGVKMTSVENVKYVRAKKILRRIFPSAKSQEKNYPVLKKCKLLLPLVWCHRAIKALLFHRKKVKENMAQIALLSKENISNYKSELDFVGLKFDFKE